MKNKEIKFMEGFSRLDEDGSTPNAYANVLDKDLAAARADPAIKWIVVAFHEPLKIIIRY
jgi:hypothetical protein